MDKRFERQTLQIELLLLEYPSLTLPLVFYSPKAIK
jgi:hypothetical protein